MIPSSKNELILNGNHNFELFAEKEVLRNENVKYDETVRKIRNNTDETYR